MISQTILHKDLITYSKIYEEFGLNISFEIENNQLKKSDDGFLELDKNNQLKLKLGPKYFFSNLSDMRVYDSRTNQIILQSPDSLIFKYINSMFRKEFIDSLNIFEKNDKFYIEDSEFKIEIEKDSLNYFCKINFSNNSIQINNKGYI